MGDYNSWRPPSTLALWRAFLNVSDILDRVLASLHMTHMHHDDDKGPSEV